jgi:hypothetical protein
MTCRQNQIKARFISRRTAAALCAQVNVFFFPLRREQAQVPSVCTRTSRSELVVKRPFSESHAIRCTWPVGVEPRKRASTKRTDHPDARVSTIGRQFCGGRAEERGGSGRDVGGYRMKGLAKIGCRPYYFGQFWKLRSTDDATHGSYSLGLIRSRMGELAFDSFPLQPSQFEALITSCLSLSTSSPISATIHAAVSNGSGSIDIDHTAFVTPNINELSAPPCFSPGPK